MTDNTLKVKRIEAIVSKTSIIWETIQDNIPQDSPVAVEFVYLNKISEINRYKKIDLLILDKGFNYSLNRSQIKTIVTLVGNQSDTEQIRVNLPCRLSYLLDIIYNDRMRQQIFCWINNQWIYDQQLATIFNDQAKLKLTVKENEIFVAMLIADNYQINKEDLLKNIWQYHHESDSNTIETHMYRLKQKLPANLLQYKENYYQLMISNIE